MSTVVKEKEEVLATEEIAVVQEEQIILKGGKIYAFFKRAFDIVSSFCVIAVISWLLLIIAIIVKLTSKGPILFKDIRVGKNMKPIKVYKFRSMYIDAEKNIDKYLTPEQKLIWEKERKLDDDPRITKVGKFLRKTSLDELPQLFNILFGSLSVVGPRPVKMSELEMNYSEYQRKMLAKVKPGLTGYWQVYGRSNVDYASGERQKEELAYLPKRGFWYDLKLIFLTIPAVLSKRGAK